MYKTRISLLLLLTFNIFATKINSSSDIIFAHRGFSAYYPENTVIAYEKAYERGFNGFECDVAISSDGVPFMMHDKTLDRTTNGSGECSKTSWNYIKNLDAGSYLNSRFSGERIPSLEQVLDHFADKDIFILIEIKDDKEYGTLNLPEKTAELITEKRMENKCLVFSFSTNYVDRVRKYNSKILTGYLTVKDIGIIDKAVKNGHKFVSFKYDSINKEIIDYAHKNHLKINAWTVDSKQDAKRAADLGVDWLTSNNSSFLDLIDN